MKIPGIFNKFIFLVYTITIFIFGYYTYSHKDRIVYLFSAPEASEYIGNNIDKQEFIFYVQHYGRISVSYKAFNADKETANIIHSLLLLNKQNFAISPKTPDTTRVYIVGKKKWLFLNPALKAMLNIIYSP